MFEDQVACADIVLLTKADLAGADGLAAAQRDHRGRNAAPHFRCCRSPTARSIRASILGLGAAAEDDLAARPAHHEGHDEHEHDDFDTIVVELPEVADIDALVAPIERLARDHNVLRAKGYIAVAGKPMRLLVQAVGERVRHQFDRPGARGRGSRSWS